MQQTRSTTYSTMRGRAWQKILSRFHLSPDTNNTLRFFCTLLFQKRLQICCKFDGIFEHQEVIPLFFFTVYKQF